jgi:hypothetical protein
MAGKNEQGKAVGGKGTSIEKIEKAPRQTLIGKMGQAIDSAAEVAGANALGKVAEAFGKAEAAAEAQLGETEKGYYTVMGKLADKADTRDERDNIRDDVNKARDSSHKNIEERSRFRWDVLRNVAMGIVTVVGALALGSRFKR